MLFESNKKFSGQQVLGHSQGQVHVQVLKIGTAQVQVPSTTSLVIVLEIFSF